MATMSNPFILNGFVSAMYYCDREKESRQLVSEITNGNNVALIAARKNGKTALIKNCIRKIELNRNFFPVVLDIYPSRSLRDFTFLLARAIVEQSKPFGRKITEEFRAALPPLMQSISVDAAGNVAANFGLGDVLDTMDTLNRIFTFIDKTEKPFLIAIDEFQQILSYPEKDAVAAIQTNILQCKSCRFVLSGSRRNAMKALCFNDNTPLCQISMCLENVDRQKYITFAQRHFKSGKREITEATVGEVYDMFAGTIWYVQRTLNTLYSMTAESMVCKPDHIAGAISVIIEADEYAMTETIFRLPEKQKELLVAIAKESEAKEVTSSKFVRKHNLTSASSVQAALKGLLEKDFITLENDVLTVNDRFLAIWLREKY
jgi:hypothetical protein